MAHRLTVDDRTVWLKHYGSGARRLRLGLLGKFARGLDIEALRPPPHHPGEQAKHLEVRRLHELRAADVRVPDVIGDGPAMLVLSDIGESLSRRLAAVSADPDERDALVGRAVAAIAEVHARGQYLGQPIPRNMAIADDAVGFLDFEEDPVEVMSPRSAQIRDWLLFVHGVAGHFPQEPAHLAQLVRQGLDLADPMVMRGVDEAGHRLHVVELLLKPFGARAGGLGVALRTLRAIASALLVAAIILLVDFLPDGDLDLDLVAWSLGVHI